MVGSLNSSPVRTNIFYINDVHGQVSKMERIVTAANMFDRQAQQTGVDTFKVSAGDIMLGEDIPTINTAINFLNLAGINLSTMGNHEMDKGFNAFKKNLERARTLFLGTNMNFPSGKDDKIVISTIKEINGHKYGFLGIQPITLVDRLKDKSRMAGVTIDSLEQTIKELQEAIDSLKKKDVDKIILLSHAGFEEDKKIAKALDGLDIIIGGHSHDLIKGATLGNNLVLSKKGEPVIITQAGRDGDNFGVLSLEFDEKGVIKKVENSIFDTEKFDISLEMRKLANQEFGESKIIGKVAKVPPKSQNPLIEENPYAQFMLDVVKEELDADIAFFNAACFRGSLKTGDVTDRDIKGLAPFKNKLVKAYLTEKELVDAIKVGTKSMTECDNKPGLLYFSGLKYTLNKKGDLINLTYTDKKGNNHLIDVNNPGKDKKYLCAFDDYLARGGDGYLPSTKINEVLKYYNSDKDILTIERIKNIKKPLTFSPDGRIRIID